MRITPLDVRKQEFDRALRGLDPDEVHAFLATVADEYEAVLTDNKQLREKVIELDQKVGEYRNMERTLRDTLLTAERVMTDARQNARKEAENILREAEVKAREATSNIQNQVDALRAQMRELRGQRDGFLARLQSLAEAQIGLTESYRKDFRDDDDRTERLMRDPGPLATPVVAPSVDTTTAETGVSETSPRSEGAGAGPTDASKPVPPVDVAPTTESRPVDVTQTAQHQRSDQNDSWRNYDLQIGATPPAPTTRPVDTSGPVEAVDPETRAPRNDEITDTTPVGTELSETLDEVTGAVDSALESAPKAEATETPSGAFEAITGETPGLAPALGAEQVSAEKAMERAEAVGQTPDELPTPDVPDPTDSRPIDAADGAPSGRWSLSRFTKGLAGS